MSEPGDNYKREYISSLSVGRVEISFTGTGGKLPVGVEADETIELFQIIIRQIERARDEAAALLAKIEDQDG